MRRLVPVVLVLPALLVPEPATGSVAQDRTGAADSAVRCLGKKATIVGRPGQARLFGTKGDDVIVTNGARWVNGRMGDDRICITKRGAAVHGRGGNDVVKVVITDYREVWAHLGGGRDTFIGGPRKDEVAGSGDGGTEEFGDDNERDVIRTKGGNDYVIAGGPAGLADRIDLGAGRDQVEIRTDRMVDGGSIDGGRGRDHFRIDSQLTGGQLVIDATAGQGTRNGVPFLDFAELELYQIRFSRDALLTFLGSSRDEYAYLFGGAASGDLGDGDDTIVGYFGSADTEVELSGGGGDDRLVLNGSDVAFDAGAGSASGGPQYGSANFDGFEWLHGVGETVAMTGSTANETLVAYGCAVSIHGLAGADTLRSYAGPEAAGEFGCEATSSELFGEAGDDQLDGGQGPDILVGGEGEDRADGGRGEDVCEAEVRVSCEASARAATPRGRPPRRARLFPPS